MGVPIEDAARGFSQISVAAQAAGMSTEHSKRMFMAASEASVAYGMSAEDTAGTIRAFTQILGKQRVTAEELRGQLGDRMPNAVALMAQAAGVGVKELDKLLQAGALGTDTFFKFTELLRKSAHESGAYAAGLKTISRSFERLKNTLKGVAMETGEGGLSTAISTALELLSGFVHFISKAVSGMIDFAGTITLVTAGVWAFNAGLLGTIGAVGTLAASLVALLPILWPIVAIGAAIAVVVAGFAAWSESKSLREKHDEILGLNEEIKDTADYIDRIRFYWEMFIIRLSQGIDISIYKIQAFNDAMDQAIDKYNFLSSSKWQGHSLAGDSSLIVKGMAQSAINAGNTVVKVFLGEEDLTSYFLKSVETNNSNNHSMNMATGF
jgi:tape measure domain-containing protein